MKRRGGPGSGRRRGRPTFDDDVDYDDDEPAEKSARGRKPRPQAAKKRGRGKKTRPASGFDFSAAEDDADQDDQGEYEEPRGRRGRGGRRAERGHPAPEGGRRESLMALCTPLFGYVSVLPTSPAEIQPSYAQYREGVLSALKRLEAEAPQCGIEQEDARNAAYALCLLMDTQIAGSGWEGKIQWATEPLTLVLQQDPEGGINFFRRLEALSGERHKAVKEVYLVCLAFGFRGRYAELEPAEQAAQINAIRRNIVQSIRPKPLMKRRRLFPRGYEQAEVVEDEVPPPPRWWLYASGGCVVLALVLYVLFYWWSGAAAAGVDERLRSDQSAAASTRAALTTGSSRP